MKYDKLYLNILEIGIDRLDTGLSYEDLKSDLEKKGYDFENDCIELAVKQWFFDCFHHRANDKLESIEDLENHLECNFVLKGQSCLTLIEHKNSKRNLQIAMIAVIIGIISLFTQLPNWSFKANEKESPNPTFEQRQEPIIKAK